MFEFCFDCALKSKSIDSCRVVIKLKNDDIFKKFFMIIKMIMIVVVFNMHEKTIPSNHSIWYLLYDLYHFQISRFGLLLMVLDSQIAAVVKILLTYLQLRCNSELHP